MKRRKFFGLIIAASLTACSGGAIADDNGQLLWLIEKADRNEPVMIPAGDYDIADVKIRDDITLVGDGEVKFYSSRPVEKGLLNPLPGVSLRVENITFEGAESPDLNGAGIRHDGDDLTVVNCKFIDNDDGILATGSEDGVIILDQSEFIGNGHGDGYSHGIYVLHAEKLEVKDSRFVGTKIGHHIKSLAGATVITGTAFDDANGRPSYAVDASRGGYVMISNNSFIQAANADNQTLINYDLTRGGEAIAVTITNNVIVNRHRNGRLLRNATAVKPTLQNNKITNEGQGRFRTK